MKSLCKSIFLILFTIGFTPISANEINTISDVPTVSPCKENLVWRYKKVKGKTYKRQWNTTTNKWVGDWIPC